MSKILIDLIIKLLTANGLENNKNAFWRNVAVIGIIVAALGLLQYSEVMLDVRKIRATSDIQRPVQLLEFKLEMCQAQLSSRENDLKFCRSRPKKPDIIEKITGK